MTKTPRPLKRSFLIVLALFLTLLCAVLGLVQYFRYHDMLYHRCEIELEAILNYAAGEIDTDDLAACIRTGEKSQQYLALQKELDQIRDRVDIHFIYVVIPLNTQERDNIQNVIAGVSAEEYREAADELVQLNQLTGDSYSPSTARRYLEAYESGKLSFFREKSQWGTDYTGLLPLVDSAGNRVAALCVDLDVAAIDAEVLKNTLTTVGIILALGLLLALLFYVWITRSITRPIEDLTDSVTKFAACCQDPRNPGALEFQGPVLRSRSEVGSLARSMTAMSEAMQRYVTRILRSEDERAELTILATKDQLTEVRNKTAFSAFSADLEAKRQAGNTKFAVLMVDLNYLKKINDTYGHEKGNLYIKKNCYTICTHFRHSPVFRVGGDEFVVILQGKDYQDREKLLQKARVIFGNLITKDTEEPWELCSAAIGIAECEGGQRTVDELLALADEDMYREKERVHGRRTSKEAF